MRSLAVILFAGALGSGSLLAQFGGRDGDVVIYSVSCKGRPEPVVVPATTVNTASGFEARDPAAGPLKPFGPDVPGEFYVDLHNETADNFRFIIQRELPIPHNRFIGPGKVMIIKGVDRLIIPGKEPIDLTAGLYAPFPQDVDFGPELPILEANSFLWTPFPTFPLIQKMPDDYKGPMVPADQTGNEYVLDIGSFVGILPWKGFNQLYAGGWQQGIDEKLIENDTQLGMTSRFIRLRPGRRTPPFVIRANTHLAVLSGSVTVTPLGGGAPAVLTKNQYAFIPNGYAVVLSNPKAYDGPTAEVGKKSVETAAQER